MPHDNKPAPRTVAAALGLAGLFLAGAVAAVWTVFWAVTRTVGEVLDVATFLHGGTP